MAGQLAVTAYVNCGGPLFDGAAGPITERFAKAARQAIAEQGLRELRDFPMNKTGRARGGFEGALRIRSRGDTLSIPGPMIKGVAWAPWLEGTSKRNTTTRFGGYHLFRKTRSSLDRQATEIAERQLPPFLAELGGQ